MPRKPNPPQDNPTQSKRFIEEAEKYRGNQDAFSKIVDGVIKSRPPSVDDIKKDRKRKT